MDEELLKRNTDCVYFLASPFTCKKGAECEYRHSEMARLNPRDCWYWLSGNCVNPTCAYRHPPLEVPTEASSKATPSLPDPSSVPATKTSVPCYYYFNGFCKNGVRCPFMHEPDDSFAWKQKMTNTVADAPVQPLDSKIPGRTDTAPAPASAPAPAPTAAKKPPSSSEIPLRRSDGLQVQQKLQVQQLTLNNMRELNASTQACVSEDEETAFVKEVSLNPAGGLTKSGCEPSLGSDQSSEELIDDNHVRDEWWESSPGFDVLVDGKTEDMAYDDDPEYLHALDGDDGDHESFFLPRGHVDQNDFDQREFLRSGLYEPSEYFDDEYSSDLRRYSPRRSVDRRVGRVASRKRKLLSVDFPDAGHDSVDLRDFLRRRKRTVGSYMEGHALTHDLARRREERQERLQRHGSKQRLHGRVASYVDRNGVGLARRTSAVDADQRGRPRYPWHTGPRDREYYWMKWRQSSTEGQWRSSSMRERDTRGSTFSGPKSLAEIKEGKGAGHSIRNGSVDFDGPKPLSEILKDKKKAVSSGDGTFNISS